MSGYLDGCNDIILKETGGGPGGTSGTTPHAGCLGKISYLGGHQYQTQVPVTSGSESQGTRLFLNALFEADCVTGGGGGFGDTDGDGVPDDTDSDPNDPNVCGDSDGDGCDDCSSGHFDLINDCDGSAGGSPGGCCDTRHRGSPGVPVVLAGLALGFALRRRRRDPAVGTGRHPRSSC